MFWPRLLRDMRAALLAAVLVSFAGGALAQSKAEQDEALRQIDAFATLQARTDPHYTKIEDELLLQISGILNGGGPSGWLPAIKRVYFAASERLHREEGDRVMVEERAASPALPASASPGLRATSMEARFAELTKDLESGRYGPREHALHALAAALILYADDPGLIAWRRAKVPIATAYEMGRITRDEYEERWNRITAIFNENRATKTRELADLEARIAAEELRIQGDAIRAFGDRFRRPPPVNCTTRSVPGMGLQTTCR